MEPNIAANAGTTTERTKLFDLGTGETVIITTIITSFVESREKVLADWWHTVGQWKYYSVKPS